jgi:hypothetical protein
MISFDWEIYLLTLHFSETALRSVATGRLIYGRSVNDSESPAIDKTVCLTDNSVPLDIFYAMCAEGI